METIKIVEGWFKTRDKIHFVDYANFLEFLFDDSAFDQAPAVKVRSDGEKLIIVEGWFKDGAFEAREAAAYPLDKVAEPLSLTLSEYDALIDGSYYGLDRLNEFNGPPAVCCGGPGRPCLLDLDDLPTGDIYAI